MCFTETNLRKFLPIKRKILLEQLTSNLKNRLISEMRFGKQVMSGGDKYLPTKRSFFTSMTSETTFETLLCPRARHEPKWTARCRSRRNGNATRTRSALPPGSPVEESRLVRRRPQRADARQQRRRGAASTAPLGRGGQCEPAGGAAHSCRRHPRTWLAAFPPLQQSWRRAEAAEAAAVESRFAAPLRYLLRTTSRNWAPPPPAGFLFPSGPLRCHLAGP